MISINIAAVPEQEMETKAGAIISVNQEAPPKREGVTAARCMSESLFS